MPLNPNPGSVPYSGGDGIGGQPPNKKARMENETIHSAVNLPQGRPITGSIMTPASLNSAISLTISNDPKKGMINMRPGGQGDALNNIQGKSILKGPATVSQPTHLQHHGVLKIPNPRPLQFRMTSGRGSLVAGPRPTPLQRIPYRPPGLVSMASNTNVPMSPTFQMVHPMSVQSVIQPQVAAAQMSNSQSAVHPLAGAVIPASSVKVDSTSPNGQTSTVKRKEQLIASKPPPGTVPIAKNNIAKTSSAVSTSQGPLSPVLSQQAGVRPVQLTSKLPSVSVVPAHQMATVTSTAQFSMVRPRTSGLLSPNTDNHTMPQQISLVRTQSTIVSSQGSNNGPAHGQPLSILRSPQATLLSGQTVVSQSPHLSIVHTGSPQQPLMVTRSPSHDGSVSTVPTMTVVMPAVQSSLAGLKPGTPLPLVLTSSPTMSQPTTLTSTTSQRPLTFIQAPGTQGFQQVVQKPSGDSPKSTENSTPVSKTQASDEKAPITSSPAGTAPNPDSGDFDPVQAMTWENGIGTLPGSDLKFRMNEFGMMEMITDDLFMDTTEETKVKPGDKTDDTDKKDNSCKNCGKSVTKPDRFCSDECNKAHSEKRPDKPGPKKQISKDGSVVKKKKKKGVEYVKEETGGESPAVKTTGEPLVKRSKGFVWNIYLEENKAVGAPTKLFKEPFPSVRNGFKLGMRCEGIDPSHQSLFCVLSVAEVKGFRLRMHFDGYSESYDFWINADSPFIFPVGWCEKNDKTLQPPKGFTSDFVFNWGGYLKFCGAQAAPKHLFINQHAASFTPNAFRVGQKLEAVDLKNTTLICVASVADTLGDKILVHFDGWEDDYDYWCEANSPYIHPVGWCQQNAKALSPPCDWEDVSNFTWEKYLNQCKASPVPSRAFKQKAVCGFEVGMKLETVDKRNPILIRVATVAEVVDNQLRVHFDGWSDIYDIWMDDDSPELHPPGWCGRTGHPLQPPIYAEDLIVAPGQGGCPTPGCKGYGHIKGAKYTGHHSAFGCPYSQTNMTKDIPLVDRLLSGKSEDGLGYNSLPAKSLKPSERVSPELRPCSTRGCDGSGHITGKYAAHSKSSGCPMAQQNIPKPYPKEAFKPGRGRGRKKHKFLHWREKRDREETSPGTSPESGVTGSGYNLHNGIHQSVFMSAMVPNPAKDLPLCWDQHSKLLPGVDKIKGGQVASWSIDDVANFVKTLPGCEEQATVFLEEQIDGEAFLLLNQADIVKIMNIKLGPALKIYNSILMFKSSTET